MEGGFTACSSYQSKTPISIDYHSSARLIPITNFDNTIVSSYGIRKVANSTEAPYADM